MWLSQVKVNDSIVDGITISVIACYYDNFITKYLVAKGKCTYPGLWILMTAAKEHNSWYNKIY